MQKNDPLWRECGKLWSRCVKVRANYRCQVEGCNQTATDAHHVISRNCSALEFDLRNGVALCRGHHNHSSSKMLERGIEIIGFEMYQELCETGRKVTRLRYADLVLIRDRLEKAIKHYKEINHGN